MKRNSEPSAFPNGQTGMGEVSRHSRAYLLCYAAVIAAVYVVLTLAFAPISFGPIQFRISEMLCVLPAFTFAAVPGVAIGCLLANILAGAMMPDIIFGTLATLIGAIATYWLCQRAQAPAFASMRWRLLAVLPPIISNAAIIPFVLKYAYHLEDAVWFMVITVGVGEILAVGVLGNVLIGILCRYSAQLFGPVSGLRQSRL